MWDANNKPKIPDMITAIKTIRDLPIAIETSGYDEFRLKLNISLAETKWLVEAIMELGRQGRYNIWRERYMQLRNDIDRLAEFASQHNNKE